MHAKWSPVNPAAQKAIEGTKAASGSTADGEATDDLLATNRNTSDRDALEATNQDAEIDASPCATNSWPASLGSVGGCYPVSYTHLTLPTTPYV